MKIYCNLYSLALFIVLIMVVGCNPALVPLKGNYVDSPLELTSAKSIDATWLMITDLFAANGLVVESIDKKKGLIITTKTPFISPYTFENKDGQLKESQAWVVLQKVLVNKKEWIPKKIYSQWNIQVTESGKGTRVKVDPVVICTYYPNIFTSVQVRSQSTGGLEEHIKSSLTNDLVP